MTLPVIDTEVGPLVILAVVDVYALGYEWEAARRAMRRAASRLFGPPSGARLCLPLPAPQPRDWEDTWGWRLPHLDLPGETGSVSVLALLQRHPGCPPPTSLPRKLRFWCGAMNRFRSVLPPRELKTVEDVNAWAADRRKAEIDLYLAAKTSRA